MGLFPCFCSETQRSDDVLHTVSDGLKCGISVDSLNANHSFKYFGKGRGVSVNRFQDERLFSFHSQVFSPTDREAPHLIDGLLQNDVVKSDFHITDTHGFNEIIFAVTNLISVRFTPRIKNVVDQVLYSFLPISHYQEKGYKILPDRYINIDLIEEYWDDILRLIATIKLKHTTATQIFKRLSSYSKSHPLYQALQEYGRAVKTILILDYIDDVELRQIIEVELSKVELANKFSRAIRFGNNQEFNVETKDEQEIIEGCRRLIHNAIVCWNYLYLSELVANADTNTQKQEFIEKIRRSSILTWHHINMFGEYNFSILRDLSPRPFDVPKILSLIL
ncbi:MAG: Tn3 family transposase [Candidatus Margulisbacteria bacterium]|nr:Tn3 family transposase [Candidatus Margulisiibacteriota bacterium]